MGLRLARQPQSGPELPAVQGGCLPHRSVQPSAAAHIQPEGRPQAAPAAAGSGAAAGAAAAAVLPVLSVAIVGQQQLAHPPCCDGGACRCGVGRQGKKAGMLGGSGERRAQRRAGACHELAAQRWRPAVGQARRTRHTSPHARPECPATWPETALHNHHATSQNASRSLSTTNGSSTGGKYAAWAGERGRAAAVAPARLTVCRRGQRARAAVAASVMRPPPQLRSAASKVCPNLQQ